MDGDLQRRARGSRRRRSGRARGAAPTCSAIRNALSARQGRGYPWMGISSGERVAAAGGGLAELAARPHLQRYQERSERPAGRRPAGGRYPWGRSPAGERVAAAGGGLAELAARPHLQRYQERSERPTGARVPMDGDLQRRARGSRRRRSGRARGAAPPAALPGTL